MSLHDKLPPPPRRSLKPIKLTDAATHIGVIAITGGNILVERTGECLPLDSLEEVFISEKQSIVVTDGFDHIFNRLCQSFKNHKHWQYKAVVQEMMGDTRVNTTISYFGFKRHRHDNGDSRRSRFFYPIDLATFIRNLQGFPGRTDIERMANFGRALCDFCRTNGIHPRSTGAGIAAQLLRHPAFYPEPRRHVPMWINERVRPHLPGNHYDLFIGADENVTAATYIDQSAAHHYAVRTTPMPDGNFIYGRGFTRSGDRRWIEPDKHEYEYAHIRRQFGLLYVRLSVPYLSPDKHRYLPPIMRGSGDKLCYIWTNELEYLESWGARVKYVISAFTSTEQDTGLPRYAEWAQEVQRENPWTKQLLLTAYGILATRPRRSRIIHHSGKGTEVQLPIGAYLIDGYASAIRDFLPNAVVNVLQRGLIESYVRLLSLKLAKEIDDNGGDTISIYGDGIFVRKAPGQLNLWGPWREKREIHNLSYQTAQRLTSDEITRLPGTPRFRREFETA